MALKGTTKIELTNVKTGEKEVIEKDNLVTNAVPSALENLFAWQLKTTYGTNYFAGNILPLCPNLFGGILLFEDSIPEDENHLFAQSDNKLIGYSSRNVNSGSDTMRGSMNQTESGVLDTNDGYRFVFDFETSQANGTISAVGLTSKWGGMAGYGSTFYNNTQAPNVFLGAEVTATNDITKGYVFNSLLHYNEDTGIATSMYVSSQNMISVSRVQMHTKNWKLTRSMNTADSIMIVDTQIIETETFAENYVSSNGTTVYHTLCDGGDGYIWGFEHSGNVKGNSSGKATINWIKIKVDDLSFEEGTWEIDGQLYVLGKEHNNSYSNKTANIDQKEQNVAVLDGYLYCINYAKTGLYKINLSNVTDIKFIKHPHNAIQTGANRHSMGSYYYNHCSISNLAVVANRVCMWNGWINGDSIVPNNYSISVATGSSTLKDGWIEGTPFSYPSGLGIGNSKLKMGVFSTWFSAFTEYASDVYKTHIKSGMILNSPYLATINNLPTPVEKTADKTMKITYILREEVV